MGHFNQSITYLSAGRWQAAIASAETALRLSPGYDVAQFVIGESLLFQGETEAALEAMQRERSEVFRLMGLSMVHHALQDAPTADAALAEAIDKYGAQWPYKIAAVLAYRDQADRAFEWLEKAAEKKDDFLAEIVVEPSFASIKSDPRWLPFLESIGKSPEQLAAIEFEVTLPR